MPFYHQLDKTSLTHLLTNELIIKHSFTIIMIIMHLLISRHKIT